MRNNTKKNYCSSDSLSTKGKTKFNYFSSFYFFYYFFCHCCHTLFFLLVLMTLSNSEVSASAFMSS